MIGQLRLLVKLQSVDKTLYDLEQELGQIPAILDEIRSQQDSLQGELNVVQAELDQVSGNRQDMEKRNEEVRARQRKADSRLMGAKTQKEYQAANAEIDEAKDSIRDSEEVLIALMERQESLQSQVNEMQAKLDGISQVAKERGAELEARLATLQGEANKLRKERSTMLGDIEITLMDEYDFIRERRQGVALAPVSQGSCGACHMRLPPQQYNELQRMDKIMTCPSCRRMIFWADAEEFSDLC